MGPCVPRKFRSWFFVVKMLIVVCVVGTVFLTVRQMKGRIPASNHPRIKLLEVDKLESVLSGMANRDRLLPSENNELHHQQQQQEDNHQLQQQQQQEEQQQQQQEEEDQQLLHHQHQQHHHHHHHQQQQKEKPPLRTKPDGDRPNPDPNPNPKPDPNPDPNTRMKQRLAQAEAYCSARRNDSSSYSRFRASYKKVRECDLEAPGYRSRLCPIAKIASTFWTRFYTVLRRTPPSSPAMDSPYTVPLDRVEDQRCPVNKNAASSPSSSPSLRAVFVREPFSRVLSAYVDKLLSPNPTYWTKWGRPSMKASGLLTNSSRLGCGQAVTFAQFFDYVLKRLHRLDNHVMPMVVACDPCSSEKKSFDLIGNMETFPDDLKLMMKSLNVTFKTGVSISRQTKLDAIYDSIQGPFSWMRKVLACVSSREMGRRIWRKLQIRGLISSGIAYPLGNTNLSRVSVDEFYKQAVAAHDKSTDKRQLSRQKRVAFIEAFRSIPLDRLRQFQWLYRYDFRAFGYETSPAAVFQREGSFAPTNMFDVERDWVVS